MMSENAIYDYIVVGGGSAGCATAGRLVSKHGAKVLLLEGGWPDTSRLIDMPAGFVKMLFQPGKFVVDHQSTPQAALNGRSINVLQANVLGGGSSVNAMTYTRGTKEDYDAWDAELGGAGWNWEGLLPYFVRQEGNQRLGAPLHGTEGPLKVSDSHHPPCDISRAFLLALQGAGVPYNADFNSGDERGAGFIQSTTYRGKRCSSARAFIDPIRNDPRLTIKYRSPVTKLVFEGNRVVGVEFNDGGNGVKVAKARHEVVLAAGAFISPKILMLSGIGPAEHLRQLGITLVRDLPGVGQNMQDHNDASIFVETNANYGYSGEDRGIRMILNGLQYLLYGTGPVASTGSEVTAFVDPDDFNASPLIQFYCMGTIYPVPGVSNPPPPGITLIANLIAPKSRGSMKLRSANPLDTPIIDPNWLSDPADVAALVSGLRLLLRSLKVAPLSQKVKGVLSPISEASSDQELADYCRKVTGTNWHPVGSCRMGTDADETAVVDPQLRVRGVKGVRVFDGSIMPRIISANTNGPIMAIAEKGVDMMVGERT